MWLDALALLLLGAFAGVGALRGGLASGLSLLSLGVAYGAALVGAPILGPPLAAALSLPPLLGLPLAGTGIFLGIFVGMGVLSAVLRRLERAGRSGGRSPRDRFLGAVFGAARGALVVLLVGWLALWLDALRATGGAALVPELGASRTARITEGVVAAGVEAALDEGSGARVAARLASRPGRALSDLQAVVESPSLEALRGDALFWTYVESGAVDAALNRGSFLQITHDAELRRRFADLGLVEDGSADDPAAFRAAAAEVLHEVGPRLRGLREDPALQQLMRDPEVIALVQSGDTFALMGHEGFRQLVERVAAGN